VITVNVLGDGAIYPLPAEFNETVADNGAVKPVGSILTPITRNEPDELAGVAAGRTMVTVPFEVLIVVM
jgi:hypothetical protein